MILMWDLSFEQEFTQTEKSENSLAVTVGS